MFARKVRKKCEVRGCNSLDTYAIARTREVGNSIIVCKACLAAALDAIKTPQAEPAVRVSHSEAPPLFFNSPVQAPVVEDAKETADVESPVPQEANEAEATPPADAEAFVCPHCGQVCKSESGLRSHIAAKHKDLA